jgi:hypothetical protein
LTLRTTRWALLLAGALVLLFVIGTGLASPMAQKSASAQVDRCKKKFPGKSKKQRQAKSRCIRKLKDAAPKAPAPVIPKTPPSTSTPQAPPSVPVPDTVIDSAPSGWTAQTAVAIAFHSSPPAASFQCDLDGTGWVACGSPRHYSGLDEGTYKLDVRATAGGKPDPTPASTKWTVDTAAPLVSVGAPVSGAASSDPSLEFSGTAGTATGDSATVEVSVWEGPAAAGSPVRTQNVTTEDGSWTAVPPAAFADGVYTVRASQHDEAGHAGQSSPVTFSIDTSPPGPVTGLSATPGAGAMHLSWVNPPDGDLAGAVVRRNDGPTPPSSPSDGVLVGDAQAPGASIGDNGVAAGQTYSYAVFAHDGAQNFAPAVTVTQAMPTCTISWVGSPGSLDWASPGNWDLGRVPGPNDVVCVLGEASEPEVEYLAQTSIRQLIATRPIALYGGELELTDSSRTSVVSNLLLFGGSLGGPADVTLEGEALWEAGGFIGQGHTFIPAGSLLTVATSGCCPASIGEGHTLAVAGSLKMTDNSTVQLLENSKLLNTGTVGIQSGASIYSYNQQTTHFVNQGTLEKSGEGASLVVPLFDNSGSVSTSGSLLSFEGANSSGAADSGSYATSGDATVAFYGGRTLGAQSSLSGDIEWRAGELSGTVPAGSLLTVATSGCCPASIGEGHTLAVAGTLVATNSFGVSFGDQSTLAFLPGSVFKAGPSVFLEIPVAANLDLSGTAQKPVTFTSIKDDSAGGDTNRDGSATAPEASDWGGIGLTGTEADELVANLGYLDLRYMANGLYVSGNASVALRGRFSHDSQGIRACNWGTTCSVDAAYVDWGKADGPETPGFVCGAVTFSPYLYEGAAHEGNAGAENCDQSETPWESLGTGQESFNLRVAQAESLCAQLEDDVCEVIDTAFACLSGAFDIGAGQLPFALPNPFTGGASGSSWKGAAGATGAAGAKWLSGSADSQVASVGKVASRGFQILGLANTFASLANAYNQCAP